MLGDLNGGASLFQFGLDLVGFFFGDAFLDGGGSRLNQLFRLAQAQGSDFPNGLDNVNLVGANVFEADLKFRLVFGSGPVAFSRGSAGSRCCGDTASMTRKRCADLNQPFTWRPGLSM